LTETLLNVVISQDSLNLTIATLKEMLKSAVLVALLAGLAFRLQFFYFTLDFHKSAAEIQPSASFATCHHIVSISSGREESASLDLSDIPGFEDIALIDQQTGISCAGDLHNLWHSDAFVSKGSRCVLIRLERSVEREGAPFLSVEPMTITGLEVRDGSKRQEAVQTVNGKSSQALLGRQAAEAIAAINLNLHGLTIVRDPRSEQQNLRYLFGLNHAYRHGDERVEVFRVDESNLQLHHVFSIRFPNATLARFRGTLNDLVVTDLSAKPHGMLLTGAMYISSWLELADPIAGRVGNSMLALKRRALMYGRGLVNHYDNQVIRCSFDTHDLFQNKCEFKNELVARCDNEYLGGFGIANGLAKVTLANIAWTPNGKKPVEVVFAADVLGHSIKVFISPPVEGGSGPTPFPPLPATDVVSLRVRHAIDNLEPAVESVVCEQLSGSVAASASYTCSAVLYSGFIASLNQAAKLDVGLDDTVSPGGIGRHVFSLNITTSPSSSAVVLSGARLVSDEPLVMTDGHFNGLSSGVVLRDGEAAIAVLSSFKSIGLLECPIQPDI
jgi:hypothetical protein